MFRSLLQRFYTGAGHFIHIAATHIINKIPLNCEWACKPRVTIISPKQATRWWTRLKILMIFEVSARRKLDIPRSWRQPLLMTTRECLRIWLSYFLAVRLVKLAIGQNQNDTDLHSPASEFLKYVQRTGSLKIRTLREKFSEQTVRGATLFVSRIVVHIPGFSLHQRQIYIFSSRFEKLHLSSIVLLFVDGLKQLMDRGFVRKDKLGRLKLSPEVDACSMLSIIVAFAVLNVFQWYNHHRM